MEAGVSKRETAMHKGILKNLEAKPRQLNVMTENTVCKKVG